jgi:hypothetical protein
VRGPDEATAFSEGNVLVVLKGAKIGYETHIQKPKTFLISQ